MVGQYRNSSNFFGRAPSNDSTHSQISFSNSEHRGKHAMAPPQTVKKLRCAVIGAGSVFRIVMCEQYADGCQRLGNFDRSGNWYLTRLVTNLTQQSSCKRHSAKILTCGYSKKIVMLVARGLRIDIQVANSRDSTISGC